MLTSTHVKGERHFDFSGGGAAKQRHGHLGRGIFFSPQPWSYMSLMFCSTIGHPHHWTPPLVRNKRFHNNREQDSSKKCSKVQTKVSSSLWTSLAVEIISLFHAPTCMRGLFWPGQVHKMLGKEHFEAPMLGLCINEAQLFVNQAAVHCLRLAIAR